MIHIILLSFKDYLGNLYLATNPAETLRHSDIQTFRPHLLLTIASWASVFLGELSLDTQLASASAAPDVTSGHKQHV